MRGDDFLQRPKVLVVAAEIGTRESLCACLEEAGYGVGAAENALEGTREVRRGGYAVVFVEGPLRGMDTSEFVRVVRGMDFRVSVVVLAEHNDVVDAVRMMKAGASDFIHGPWRCEEILSITEQAAKRYVLRNAHDIRRVAHRLLGASGPGHASQEAMTMAVEALYADTAALVVKCSSGRVWRAVWRGSNSERGHFALALAAEELGVAAELIQDGSRWLRHPVLMGQEWCGSMVLARPASLGALSHGERELLTVVTSQVVCLVQNMDFRAHAEVLREEGRVARGTAHELSQVAHDVVQEMAEPITLVSIGARYLEPIFEGSSPEDQEVFRFIKQGATRLTEFARNLRAFANAPSMGEGDFPVSLVPIVDESLNAAKALDAQLSTSVSVEGHGLVAGHGYLLRQVVSNLVQCAVRRGEDRGAREVQVVISDVNDQVQVAFRVLDHVPGAVIFGEFLEEKLGLVVRMVHEVIERHQGEIECLGGEEGRATMVVRLPAWRSAGLSVDEPVSLG